MAKSFTVDVSDKQDRSFYVYVVEGDIVTETSPYGGYWIEGSWISKSSGTDGDMTHTAGATGYFKTTITGMSSVGGNFDDWTVTLTFPREQSATLNVNPSEVEFLESKEVIVAASATPDYPISVTVQDFAEKSPVITVNPSYQLTGQDDHLLTAAYLRTNAVKFAAEQNPNYDPDNEDDPGDEYIRTPQTIEVSYSDDVVIERYKIDIVTDTSNELIDNYAKEYELSDNQSEEKRSYTVSNWAISATWEQGPGWYRTITYPYVWLTSVDVWVSRALDQWTNEHLEEGTIEYRHGTNYGYYITVPWLCSQVHLYGVVRSDGEGSEPTSSEIAWNGREFDQKSGSSCDQWIQFSSCQNLTGQKVTVKLENSLGGTSYSPPIYIIFEPNPDLEEAKIGELGGNTGYAGDINGSAEFKGTGGLYDGVGLDEDQEYKTFSNYCYQVSPRGNEAIKIYTGKTTDVALLTWGGDSNAENESSKFWMSVEWEAACFDENVTLSISKQSQALSTLSISAVEENDGDSAMEYTVYVRPTKQDKWISFVVAQNPEYVNDATDEGGGSGGGGGGEPTYTYEIDPNPGTIGAKGGDIVFTIREINESTGEVEGTYIRTVTVDENTTGKARTITGTLTVDGAEVEYIIEQSSGIYFEQDSYLIETAESWINITLDFGSHDADWMFSNIGSCLTFTPENEADGVWLEWIDQAPYIHDVSKISFDCSYTANTSTSPRKGVLRAVVGDDEATCTITQVGEEPEPEPEPEPEDPYTYEIEPTIAYIGAEGGTLEFTLTRTSKDGTVDTKIITVIVPENTDYKIKTIIGTSIEWDHEFQYIIAQEAAEEPESDPSYSYIIDVDPKWVGPLGGDELTITITRINNLTGEKDVAEHNATSPTNTTTEARRIEGQVESWGTAFVWGVEQGAYPITMEDVLINTNEAGSVYVRIDIGCINFDDIIPKDGTFVFSPSSGNEVWFNWVNKYPSREDDRMLCEFTYTANTTGAARRGTLQGTFVSSASAASQTPTCTVIQSIDGTGTEDTYTYEISPETATVGAEGGDVVFTLTRTGSDGSTESATETITIGANTTTEEVTHTGTITLWGHAFAYTIIQEAASEEPEPEPDPEPEVTYTYTVSPQVAVIGADGGSIRFTFTRTGSDGSEETQTRSVTIGANTTTEAVVYTVSITIDDWGYTFSVTVRQDAASSGGPNTGAPPVVWPDDGEAHVKYMQLSNISEKRFGVTHVDVILDGNDRTDFSNIFGACEYLVEINEDIFSNCTNALSFERAFEGCSCLQEIPGKIFYATRQVTNFRYVFAACNELVSVPETLFQTNTQAVDFSGAFSGSINIASLPSGLFANCTRAENFSYTFYETGIRSVPASLFYSCLRVTDFSYTFSHSSLTAVPGTLFRNNTKAKDFTGVFDNCSSLTEVSETLFDNCYRAESFAHAFYNDTALEEIPDGLFRFMTSATNFSGVFGNCEKLSSIPADTFENCTSAEDFSEAFFWDAGLKAVPDDLFKNCSKATNFESAFTECSSLTYVPHDLFCATAKDADFGCAFQGCAKLSQVGYNLYHVNEKTYQLFSIDTTADVLQSNSSLRRVYLWNLTSAGLEEMGEYSDFIPTTTKSATVYIGKIVTDDDRFAGALTGSNKGQIASSKLVSELLGKSKKYTCIYVGTCELGSKEFKSEGYIETAGVFIEKSETLTLPSE